MLLRTLQFVPAIVFVVSCGKNAETNSSTPITEASYAGTWEGACGAVDGIYAKTVMTIAADKTVKQSSIQYSDSTCTTERYRADLYSTLAITGEVSATVKKVDFTASEFKIKFATDELTQTANTNKNCGYSNWVKNVEQSCLGKAVNGSGEPEITSGKKIYNVFSVDGSKLYVGTETTSEAQRPTTVTSVYSKK